MAGYGRLLREARERQRLSWEEVEAATKIRLRYLAALEAEDAIALPDPVYARGFLRIYARFLGLEPGRLLALYPQMPTSDLPPSPRPAPREIPSSALFGVVLTLLILASLVIYLSQRGEGSPTEGVGVTIEIPSATLTPAPTGASGTATATRAASPARPSPTRTAAATPTATTTPVPRVSLPTLVGIAYSQAASRLESLGLKAIKVEEWNAEVAKDLVFRQDPAPGQSLDRGDVVRLWVSRGPPGQQSITVPDVVGKLEAEARQILSAAGLNPAPYANRQRLEELSEADQQRHRNTCAGCVLSANPPGGAQVAPGTVVYLAVRA